MGRPYIKKRATEVAIGAALFVAGCVLLWDAWEGRGDRTPKLLRPLMPF